MESLQIKTNCIDDILTQLDNYMIKAGGRDVNFLRFDVGSKPNYYGAKVAMAFDRILRTSLTLCDLDEVITSEFLEKVKLTINKLN